MIHTPRQNNLAVSVWQRERPRRAVTFPSQQAASWPISLEPTSPGQLSPRVETHSADSTRKARTGKLKSPAPAPAANPTIVRPSLLSALTAPNNLTDRMLKKSASFVLVSLRGSTYRSVRLTSSLTAAALDSIFEHPGRYSPAVSDVTTSQVLAYAHSFPQTTNHVAC